MSDAAGQPAPERRLDAAGATAQLMFLGSLFLIATSRWGSYLHVPGVPFYIGDAFVAAAVLHFGWQWRTGRLSLRGLRSAPRTLWLVAAFVAWALLRIVTRTALPMVAVRDFAPYAYAVVALLTFLGPARSGVRSRRWIYAAFTFHAVWYAVVAAGIVDPATTWRIGSGATLFSTRPDFDAAVFGVAIAYVLHELAFGIRPKSTLERSAVVAFIAVNGYGLASQHSRSGLLAAAIVVSAVLATWLLRRRTGTANFAKRGAVATGALVLAALAVLFTVPGQRLVSGFDNSKGSAAAGTSHARGLVLEGMTQWLRADPVRNAFGVGYGPHILARSRTVQYLEGDEYKNVRSPHNYLLTTWARLGLIGAVLAAAAMVAVARMALGQLKERGAPTDLLAALLVLAIPVVALFGVVLESPFGAIPYFWAIGQLCASRRRRPSAVVADPPSLVSASA